jgi:hypothetical protein
MFDINAVINSAITEAVQASLAQVKQEHLNAIGLASNAAFDRLAAFEAQLMAARDRISALEDQAIVTSNRINDRITALETKLTEANLFTQMTPATITADAFVTHLDQQEWFWEKLQNRIDATIESAIDTHCETYDHDNYDEIASKVDDLPDLDDYATKDELRSEIEDVLNNATLSLSL